MRSLNLSQVLSQLQDISSRGERLAVTQQRIEEQQRCSIDEQRAILSGLAYCLQQTRSARRGPFSNPTPEQATEAFSSAVDQRPPTSSGSRTPKMHFNPHLSNAGINKPVTEWLPQHGVDDSKTLLPLHTANDHSRQNNLLFRRANMRTPRALKDFVGSLCMGYLNIACTDSTCHDPSCRPKSKSSLCLKYHFPHWFLSYAISIFVRLSQTAGPEIMLRMPKVRPPNADVFYFACTGNIDGMRYLFKSGLASPDDVEYGTGLSALHASIKPSETEYRANAFLESC